MRTNKETPITRIGYVDYCSYCGEPAKEDVTYEEYDKTTTSYCDCEGANQWVKATEEYDKAMRKITHRKDLQKYFRKLQYKHELSQLKGKYKYDRLEDLPE